MLRVKSHENQLMCHRVIQKWVLLFETQWRR